MPSPAATYATTVDGRGPWSVGLGAATPPSGMLALDGNGTNAVSVTATDMAGNASSAATQTPMVDTTAPGVTVALSATILEPSQTATMTFTFAEAPVGVMLDDVTTGSNRLACTATFTPTAGVVATGSPYRPAGPTGRATSAPPAIRPPARSAPGCRSLAGLWRARR